MKRVLLDKLRKKKKKGGGGVSIKHIHFPKTTIVILINIFQDLNFVNDDDDDILNLYDIELHYLWVCMDTGNREN